MDVEVWVWEERKGQESRQADRQVYVLQHTDVRNMDGGGGVYMNTGFVFICIVFVPNRLRTYTFIDTYPYCRGCHPLTSLITGTRYLGIPNTSTCRYAHAREATHWYWYCSAVSYVTNVVQKYSARLVSPPSVSSLVQKGDVLLVPRLE